ncbi:ankyrin [Coniochaeta ligniaria NRRL 30616]|uniref:Ankyrin n=1 Tax=Coniochaeta ligniaria NRRL 30616 TaxID=1408157 RepID=A0A1J7IQY7_9PEZI|nr:ankyrin [Coniochaeta ligniaria NRRL 30616]
MFSPTAFSTPRPASAASSLDLLFVLSKHSLHHQDTSITKILCLDTHHHISVITAITSVRTVILPRPAVSMTSLYDLTGQSSPLFTLPLEIFIEVCHYINPSDQNNLSRSCKYLTLALQKHLFERCSSPGHCEAILYGCTQPNAFVIRRALAYRCPPNVDDEIFDGNSALALASYNGHPLAVAYLLQRHASVKREGPDGLTPLAHALNGISTAIATDDRLHPHAETILRLLKAGANPKCKLPTDLLGEERLGNAITIIVDAAEDERLAPVHAKRLIEKLVNKGVSPNCVGFSYLTPLDWAIQNFEEFEDLFDLLLQKGAYVNCGTEIGVTFTAFGTAIAEENIVAMRRLISHGAFIGPAPGAPSRSSPLWFAVFKNKVDSVLTLLQHGAEPNLVDRGMYLQGGTLLSSAVCQMNHSLGPMSEPLIKLLLEFGADPNVLDVRDKPSLYYALSRSSTRRASITELLLNSNADPNEQGEVGAWSALVCAIQAHAVLSPDWVNLEPTTSTERLRVVDLLLQAGADVNLRAELLGHPEPSPLEAALVTPYPPKDDSSAEEEECLFVRGAVSDFYTLSMLFAIRTAQHGVPVDEAFAIQDIPELPWEDELIPTLLRAGATVTQRSLEWVKGFLKAREPSQFCG